MVFVVGVLGLKGIENFGVYLGFLELVYASVEGCQLFLVVSFLHSWAEKLAVDSLGLLSSQLDLILQLSDFFVGLVEFELERVDFLPWWAVFVVGYFFDLLFQTQVLDS